jgi:hypothetical protein
VRLKPRGPSHRQRPHDALAGRTDTAKWRQQAAIGNSGRGEIAISLTGDILIGPDLVTDARDSSQTTWRASSWLRLGVGYRF